MNVACFLASASFAEVCLIPNAQNTSTVNIAFRYSDRLALRGTLNDLDFFNRATRGISLSELSFQDDNFKNKKNLMQSIADQIQDRSFVIFNYSGHGVMVPKLDKNGKWDGREMEWAILLPVSKGNAEATLPSNSDYLFKQISELKKEYESLKGKGGSDKGLLDDIDRYIQIAQNKLKRSIEAAESGEWKSNVVTQSELASLFKGKHVAGVVEACYSGALSELADNIEGGSAQFLMACSDSEKANDFYTSGLNKGRVEAHENLFKRIREYQERVDKSEEEFVSEFKHLPYQTSKDDGLVSDQSLSAKALALKREGLKLAEELRAIVESDKELPEVRGGLLSGFLASLDATKLDTDHDGVLSFEEIEAVLPRAIYANAGKSQRPKAASTCMDFRPKLGIPVGNFNENAAKPAPYYKIGH